MNTGLEHERECLHLHSERREELSLPRRGLGLLSDFPRPYLPTCPYSKAQTMATARTRPSVMKCSPPSAAIWLTTDSPHRRMCMWPIRDLLPGSCGFLAGDTPSREVDERRKEIHAFVENLAAEAQIHQGQGYPRQAIPVVWREPAGSF